MEELLDEKENRKEVSL